jgi:predicted phosphodiesterase
VRLAIFSDIHEDLNSLKRVLKKIDQKGCDMRICLGDISGFSEPFYRYRQSRNASACLDLIRRNCQIIVHGNHDLHAAGRIPELTAGARYEYWQHEKDLDPGYSEEEIAFLAGLPGYATLPAGDYSILFSHYIDTNLHGFIKGFYSSGKEMDAHFHLMQKQNCQLGFTGHTHVRGFYKAKPDGFRHYGYRRLLLKDFPALIGIPPVTRHKYRSGFCIFETDSRLLRVLKLY